MKTKTIISAIIISAAIWFVIGWAMEFIGWNDYHFISSVMIALIWHIAIEMVKMINNEKSD